MKRYYILAGILMLSATAGMIYSLTRNDFKNAPAQIAGCTDPAVTAIVYSLQNYPDSWERDTFKIRHDDDVSVWVGNEDYGLSLNMGSKDVMPDQYAMSDQCRAILYDATQTWTRNTLNEKLRD